MKIKYRKEKFEGFTHRFKVQFEIGEPHFTSLDIYSNSDSFQKLEDFINENKSEKVLSFKIVHRASKKEDELTTTFIDNLLSDI